MKYAALWHEVQETLERAQKRCALPRERVMLYTSGLDFARIGSHLHQAGTDEYNTVDCLIRPQLPYPIVVTIVTATDSYYL